MTEPLRLMIDRFQTPIGEMVIVADHDGNLRAVDWAEYEPRHVALTDPPLRHKWIHPGAGKKSSRVR